MDETPTTRTQLWRDACATDDDLLVHHVLTSLFGESDFYEPIEHYQPSDDLLTVIRSHLPSSWRTIRSGFWFNAIPPSQNSPIQGWKIHISAIPSNAAIILSIIARACVSENVAFKFTCDQTLLRLVNSKPWNRASSGKFITVYPHSEEHFRAFIEKLYHQLKRFRGPYILSDKRYKDCKVLYYRYGGMTSLYQKRNDGNVIPIIISADGLALPDLRLPYFAPPPGVDDPFSTTDPDQPEQTLLGTRYIIDDVLQLSNTGGVYLARDCHDDRRVVIKEARPYTGTAMNGVDAVVLRQREWRILRELQHTGIVPEAIDLFSDWEHLFLVEEYIEGVTAHQFPARYSALLQSAPSSDEVQEYFRNVIQISKNLAAAVDAAHSRGVIIGDLSPSNVVIRSDLSVALLDLETAYDGLDEYAYEMFTPGHATKQRITRASVCPEDDYYALGSIMLWLIFPINGMLSVCPGAASAFLNAIQHDFGLPNAMTHVIEALMAPVETDRPQPAEVAAMLETAGIEPPHRGEAETISDHRLEQVLQGICAFIESSMTPARRDRLFPGDPGTPNSMNVAYGALGVAHALKRLTREVPSAATEWILRRELRPDRYPPGLYVGLSGMAWALAELGHLDVAGDALAQAEDHPLLFNAADIFSGAAGVGLTHLRFWLLTRDQRSLQWATKIGEWLLETAHADGPNWFWTAPDGQVPLGYARGSSGISVFLLYLFLATHEAPFLDAGKRALRFDLDHGVDLGSCLSFPATEDSPHTLLPYWLKGGSAGVGTALLRYVITTGDEQLTDLLPKVVADTCRRYTVFPGLFNGLAGLGNLLLDCYQLMEDPYYLHESQRVASGILLFKVERPGGIAFPGEFLYRLSTDFGTGSAGIGMFLHRLRYGGQNFNFLLDELLPASNNGLR